MYTNKLFESYNKNLKEENQNNRSISDLHQILDNLDWNSGSEIMNQVPDYLKPMLSKLEKLIDIGYFENNIDGDYNWIVKNLIKLGYSEEDIKNNEDKLFDIIDNLENLCY